MIVGYDLHLDNAEWCMVCSELRGQDQVVYHCMHIEHTSTRTEYAFGLRTKCYRLFIYSSTNTV